jgi:5-methylcytosine-specific restriction endonuclease McrA
MPKGVPGRALCSIDGCNKVVHGKGWCAQHYGRWRKHGTTRECPRRPATICTIEGCERTAVGRGWCKHHWGRWKRTGDPTAPDRRRNTDDGLCTVNGCARGRFGHGYCLMHYKRWRTHGSPLLGQTRGRQPSSGLCTVPQCGMRSKSKGFCIKHYEKFRKYGDPLVDRRRVGRDPEVSRRRTARRRARLASADTRLVTNRDWNRLITRHGNACAYCGETGPLTQDHVVPIARGGRHAIGNLLPACLRCNQSKNSKLLIEWRAQRASKS